MKRYGALFLLAGCLLGTPSGAQDTGKTIARTLEEVRSRYAPDRRTAVFEIESGCSGDTLPILKGACDDPDALDALRKRLHEEGIVFTDSIRLLPAGMPGMMPGALVTLSSVNLRSAPAHAAELASQALMGTPLRVLDRQGSWYRVQTPDRYIGWMDAAAIALKTDGEMARWRSRTRYVYTGYLGFVYSRPDRRSPTVSDLVLGSILEADSQPEQRPGRKFIAVALPDGRRGYVSRHELRELDAWAKRPLNPDSLERTALSMTGVPYLWGGTSVKGADCSGMVKTAYFANGIVIARDASQQAATGEKIAPEAWNTCRKGDLLFFGDPASGRVTHVAMYLEAGRYVHSSGRVKTNSLDPRAEDYLPLHCLSISRITGRPAGEGIVPVCEHPWYFER